MVDTNAKLRLHEFSIFLAYCFDNFSLDFTITHSSARTAKFSAEFFLLAQNDKIWFWSLD